MERAAGIEPALSAWKAEALPLCNARITCFYFIILYNISQHFYGAIDEARTRDLRLGKATLYQLSYYRA